MQMFSFLVIAVKFIQIKCRDNFHGNSERKRGSWIGHVKEIKKTIGKTVMKLILKMRVKYNE